MTIRTYGSDFKVTVSTNEPIDDVDRWLAVIDTIRAGCESIAYDNLPDDIEATVQVSPGVRFQTWAA